MVTTTKSLESKPKQTESYTPHAESQYSESAQFQSR